jgi:hypothetical protein
MDNKKTQISDFQLDTKEVTELRWVEIGESKSNIFIDKFTIDLDKLDEVGKWAFKHKGELIHLMRKYCERYGIELKTNKK